MRVKKRDRDRVVSESPLLLFKTFGKVAGLRRPTTYRQRYNGRRELVGRCPTHEPFNADWDMAVSERGTWFCYGCGKNGTLLHFLIRDKGMGVEAAWRFCRRSGDLYKPLPTRLTDKFIRELGRAK